MLFRGDTKQGGWKLPVVQFINVLFGLYAMMIKKNTFLITAAFGISSIVFCSCLGPAPNNLTGSFCFTNSKSDILELNSQGTYKRNYVTIYGDTLSCVGEWKYNRLLSEINFFDFRIFYEDGPANLPPGNWFAKVRKQEGQVQIVYSDENDLFYGKCTK